MTNDELIKHLDKVCQEYKGSAITLENAVGMMIFGRTYGWRVAYLVHTKASIAKYEKILGLNIREILPEETRFSDKSKAYVALKKVGNFWKAVKGEIPNVRSSELHDLQPERNKK